MGRMGADVGWRAYKPLYTRFQHETYHQDTASVSSQPARALKARFWPGEEEASGCGSAIYDRERTGEIRLQHAVCGP